MGGAPFPPAAQSAADDKCYPGGGNSAGVKSEPANHKKTASKTAKKKAVQGSWGTSVVLIQNFARKKWNMDLKSFELVSGDGGPL